LELPQLNSAPPPYFTDGEQAQKVLDQGRAAIRNRLAEAEAFRVAMRSRASVVEWRCAEDFPGRFIIQQVRAADIIVVGGGGRDALGDPFMQADPGDLLMQTGRTLLVVPETSNWLDLRNVLIAWNDTPEARRAVADALPMLRKAENVIVAETVEDVYGRPGALSGAKDLVGWLSRHGVLASEQVPDDCGHAAAQLGRIAPRLAPASSLRGPTVTRGFANGFSGE
jgi:hypothetical protein